MGFWSQASAGGRLGADGAEEHLGGGLAQVVLRAHHAPVGAGRGDEEQTPEPQALPAKKTPALPAPETPPPPPAKGEPGVARAPSPFQARAREFLNRSEDKQ